LIGLNDHMTPPSATARALLFVRHNGPERDFKSEGGSGGPDPVRRASDRLSGAMPNRGEPAFA
jgi:hypothetical protein